MENKVFISFLDLLNYNMENKVFISFLDLLNDKFLLQHNVLVLIIKG